MRSWPQRRELGCEARMVTKEELESVKNELKEVIEGLRGSLNELMKWVIGLVVSVWVSVVIALLLLLAKTVSANS